MTHINLAGLEVGQSTGSIEILLTRDSLVRYAGASGDFNPIHYRDDIAASVGLPGVLAHCRPQGEAVAYLCQGGQCSAPVTTLDGLASALAGTA